MPDPVRRVGLNYCNFKGEQLNADTGQDLPRQICTEKSRPQDQPDDRLEDKPGQLSLVSDIVSACGANVVSVHHDRSDANMAITSCFLKLGLETRDAAQIEQIKQKLTEAGFKLVTERA